MTICFWMRLWTLASGAVRFAEGQRKKDSKKAFWHPGGKCAAEVVENGKPSELAIREGGPPPLQNGHTKGLGEAAPRRKHGRARAAALLRMRAPAPWDARPQGCFLMPDKMLRNPKAKARRKRERSSSSDGSTSSLSFGVCSTCGTFYDRSSSSSDGEPAYGSPSGSGSASRAAESSCASEAPGQRITKQEVFNILAADLAAITAQAAKDAVEIAFREVEGVRRQGAVSGRQGGSEDQVGNWEKESPYKTWSRRQRRKYKKQKVKEQKRAGAQAQSTRDHAHLGGWSERVRPRLGATPRHLQGRSPDEGAARNWDSRW